MLIVHVTNTDPAGAAYNFIRAINEHTNHRARLITTMYIEQLQFPKDIHDIYDGGDEIEAILKNADVIHLHKVKEDFEIEFTFNERGGVRTFKISDYVKPGKTKVVYHIHGHPAERNFPAENAAEYKAREAVLLASTPDLEEMYKPHYSNVRYFPNCVPVNDVRYLPRQSELPMVGMDGTKRHAIVQCATNSILKNSHIIHEAIEELIKDGLPIFFLRVGPNPLVPQDSSLRHKRNAAMVFDHIEGYYGLSSLEALSQGKPTIAGLSDYSIQAITKFFGIPETQLPWIIARDKDQIKASIKFYMEHEHDRVLKGCISRKFMQEVWSDDVIGNRLAAFYASL
jgi:hypothetical protein